MNDSYFSGDCRDGRSTLVGWNPSRGGLGIRRTREAKTVYFDPRVDLRAAVSHATAELGVRKNFYKFVQEPADHPLFSEAKKKQPLMRVILAYAQFLHTTLLSRLNLSFPSPILALHKKSVSLGFEVNERYHTSRRHLSKLNRLSLKCFKEVKFLWGVICGTSRNFGFQANRILLE
ncbi:hypothetical protein ACFE04_019737 [Oxalis oulophora]